MTSCAVVIERADDGGYGALCPICPAASHSQIPKRESWTRCGRATGFHLAGLREDGQPIPHPSTVAATIITLDAA